jgi:hypothetical protein
VSGVRHSQTACAPPARVSSRRPGAGGGYILAPAHHMQAETSIANIAAFYEAALDARGFLHTV